MYRTAVGGHFMQPRHGGAAQLVVLSPEAERGRCIDLGDADLVVGRGNGCDIRFDDPFVSRTHARLQRRGQTVYVHDLGSSGGTFVNGIAAGSPRALRHGDIVTFADVELRFTMHDNDAAETGIMPARSSPAASPDPSVRFDVGYQRDGVFHNVGRDQYIMQQRESFLRHVAATRTKARWLVWTGFLVLVLGFGLFAAGILRFLKDGSEAFQNQDFSGPSSTPFGDDIGGIPSGLLGWALGAVGTLMVIVGIVLHVVAAARAKRVDREFPMPFTR
jgi:hypothetical protein